MRGRIWRRSATLLGTLACLGTAAAAAPSTEARERLQLLEHTQLPDARQALQKHLQHCDTLMAVLHARRAMAFTEGQSDAASWQDMEVLVAQCHVTAEQLRDTLQQLEAEQARLRAALQPSAPQ